MRKISLLQVVIILLVVVIALLAYWAIKNGQIKLPASKPAKGDYQAVFLTNGQVYFGKLNNVGRQYIGLSDIYYLQVQQPIQPKPEVKEGQKPEDQQPKITLVKLGNEIHGPVGPMNINRDQVLFWEDLKDSGQVVQAIKKDKEGGSKNEAENKNQ